MRDKRQKATKVTCDHDEFTTKQSINSWNIFFSLEEAFFAEEHKTLPQMD